MADSDRRQVERYYRELKGYLDSFPEPVGYNAPKGTVDRINKICDEITQPSRNNYSQYKVERDNDTYNGFGYSGDLVKMKLSAFVSQLNSEFDFDTPSDTPTQPVILINNQNTNTIDISINFTLESLIKDAKTEEEKENLETIKNETSSDSADWEKIKNSLSWILNYSKDLSLKVLPIVLNYYLKK